MQDLGPAQLFASNAGKALVLEQRCADIVEWCIQMILHNAKFVEKSLGLNIRWEITKKHIQTRDRLCVFRAGRHTSTSISLSFIAVNSPSRPYESTFDNKFCHCNYRSGMNIYILLFSCSLPYLWSNRNSLNVVNIVYTKFMNY